jgi:dipeptidyl aminopeptidase/acylaminoacyl peptidase
MRRRLATTLLVLAAVGAVGASAGSSAPATFPGPSGKIALSHGLRADRPGIDLVNPDGSGRTTIPTAAGYSPAWSADGRWLVYSTFPEPWAVRVARADGSGDRELVSPGAGNPPVFPPDFAWAPSGSEIAYRCRAGLCAVRVADATTRRIFEFQSLGVAGFSWSPDGSRIAFRCPGAVLCLVNPDGTNLVGLGEPGQLATGRCCDWSPDGTRILLTADRTKVYSVDVDDGEVRLLGEVGGESVSTARWSPDGGSVLVRSFPSVYVLRLDGSAPVKLADGDIGDWGTSPAVTVSESRLEPRWTLSRQTGALRLRGVASHASSLTVAVRSSGRTHPAASVSVPAGQFTVSTPLPRDLLPGALVVVVAGASGSEPLLTVVRPEMLAAPATGLVARAAMTARRGGKQLSARFVFSVRPASARPTAVWITPSGAARLRERLPNARVVTSSLVGEERLPRGRWRCRLEVGGTLLAVVAARVG